MNDTQEAPPISMRKPPSQRTERHLDDTAKAIARLREDAKPDKASEEGQSPTGDLSKPRLSHVAKGSAPRKPTGPAISPITKRSKKMGG